MVFKRVMLLVVLGVMISLLGVGCSERNEENEGRVSPPGGQPLTIVLTNFSTNEADFLYGHFIIDQLDKKEARFEEFSIPNYHTPDGVSGTSSGTSRPSAMRSESIIGDVIWVVVVVGGVTNTFKFMGLSEGLVVGITNLKFEISGSNANELLGELTNDVKVWGYLYSYGTNVVTNNSYRYGEVFDSDFTNLDFVDWLGGTEVGYVIEVYNTNIRFNSTLRYGYPAGLVFTFSTNIAY